MDLCDFCGKECDVLYPKTFIDENENEFKLFVCDDCFFIVIKNKADKRRLQLLKYRD